MHKASITHRSTGPPRPSTFQALLRLGAIVCVTLAVISMSATLALADLTVSDGAASFLWDTDATDGTAGGSNFVEPFGSTDMQYTERWFLRFDGINYAIAGPTTQVGGGNSASVTFNGIAGGSGLPGAFEGFDVTINYTITDTGSQAHMHTTTTVTNLSAIAQDISLINYFDYDIQGFSGDEAVATSNGDVTITVRDPVAVGQIRRVGIGADSFGIGNYNGLLNGLIAGDTLTDVGSPFGPGDFTGAMQWDLNVAGGGSVSVNGSVLGTTAFVPEPSMVGALAAMTAGLGFVGLRRRRRAKQEKSAE